MSLVDKRRPPDMRTNPVGWMVYWLRVALSLPVAVFRLGVFVTLVVTSIAVLVTLGIGLVVGLGLLAVVGFVWIVLFGISIVISPHDLAEEPSLWGEAE